MWPSIASTVRVPYKHVSHSAQALLKLSTSVDKHKKKGKMNFKCIFMRFYKHFQSISHFSAYFKKNAVSASIYKKDIF